MRAPLYSFRSSTFDCHAYLREILVLPVLLRRGMGLSDTDSITVATNEEYYLQKNGFDHSSFRGFPSPPFCPRADSREDIKPPNFGKDLLVDLRLVS